MIRSVLLAASSCLMAAPAIAQLPSRAVSPQAISPPTALPTRNEVNAPNPPAAAAPQKPRPEVKRRAKARAAPPSIARIARANRDATEQPAMQGFIGATHVYQWREGAIYQLYAAPGIISDIALDPGETLIAVAAGDTVRWIIGDTTSGSGSTKRTHILVKPVATGLTTNLVITTDRRVYRLTLASGARTAMAALSWTYPAGSLIALSRTGRSSEPATIATGLDLVRLNFAYTIRGDRPAWRPSRVFDDGRQTFIVFPDTISTGDAPPLFTVGPDGTAELVNYRMQGSTYVVDRLFDIAELRLGTGKQQVVRIVRDGVRRRKERRS